LDQVELPHPTHLDRNNFLYTVYRSYIDSFDYNIWYPLVSSLDNFAKNVQMIRIEQSIKDILIKINQKQEELNHIEKLELEEFTNKIKQIVKLNEKYFVRLSGTSGKNEKSVKYFTNSEDIIQHLSSVKLFIEQEYKRDKPTYLILSKWNDSIDLKYEFRLFIFNKKITGISQQSKKLFNFTQDELNQIEQILNKFVESKLINFLSYDTCILDTYVDMDNSLLNIIEINPFGAHCGAGSSLFQWDKDYEILHGDSDKIEFRYLSIINI
jgi:hypothetical protein